MRRSALLRAAILAICALVFAPVAALAATPAWMLSDAPMSAGPGTTYDSAGKGAKGALVAVERCSLGWCKVDFEGKTGWVQLYNLSFGLEAKGPWAGEHLGIGRDNGSVCLYTGPNFSGDYLCRDSGFVVTDFARTGLDDMFVSVSVKGSASVLVCRDRNFSSYCETITKDTPRLNQFLARKVTSIRVY